MKLPNICEANDMKKIEDFLNGRLPLMRVLPISAIHSVVSMVLGLFVAFVLVTLSCNTSDVLIESFELFLLILSRYSFQYVVFKVRGNCMFTQLSSANASLRFVNRLALSSSVPHGPTH